MYSETNEIMMNMMTKEEMLEMAKTALLKTEDKIYDFPKRGNEVEVLLWGEPTKTKLISLELNPRGKIVLVSVPKEEYKGGRYERHDADLLYEFAVEEIEKILQIAKILPKGCEL